MEPSSGVLRRQTETEVLGIPVMEDKRPIPGSAAIPGGLVIGRQGCRRSQAEFGTAPGPIARFQNKASFDWVVN